MIRNLLFFLPLCAARIAIDPGHFGGRYAQLEERSFSGVNEGDLTFLTALHLKKLLTADGHTVMLTRDAIGHGALTFDYDGKKPFREKYNRLDLYARATKINAFKPDLTILIHLNALSQKPTDTNYTHMIVPEKNNEESIKLSKEILREMRQQLGVRDILPGEIAWPCTFIESGIIARDLCLTREIQGPLCYGETLLQNNIDENKRLAFTDDEIDGVPCSHRLKQIAQGYFEGIKAYLVSKEN